MLQIPEEAGLVHGHQWRQPHRHGRQLPEVGHQPGVRIRRETGFARAFPAKTFQLLPGQPAFQVGPGINPRRTMTLEVGDVPGVVSGSRMQEMVEGHLPQRGRRSVGGNVPADAVVLAIGTNHHRHRVPADHVLDAPFELAIAGIRWLLGGRNGVDIGRLEPCCGLDAVPPCPLRKRRQQLVNPARSISLGQVVERLVPFGQFLRIHSGNRR